ncbi:MAG: PHP domain-containing protein [Spirochaetales bacterium]|nr:PHP domain-containing protein [Spirochaetia bacterium]MDD7015323.1 PHP domain-containing protein [Spirochaetales bacterium]
MIDLHTHSTASDGTLTPSELVQYAFSKKISVLALTDHDTTAGIQEAASEAEKIKSSGSDFTFIPGVELNIEWPTGEFHLLGLGLKRISPELNSIIKMLEKERFNRNEKMALKLREAGVDITLEEVIGRFNTASVGRPHFAQFMVEKGIVKVKQLAFDKYFAKGRPCYVERSGADLSHACYAIKQSGGIPVQAHPLSMYVSWGKIKEALVSVKECGVEGLEAWHPGIRISEAERLESLAHELGMFATAGSDYHGKVRSDRHIGFTAGKTQIKDRYYYEELLPHLNP